MSKSKMNLKDLIEFASANTEKIFRATGVMVPMWHAVTKDGEVMVLTAPDFCDNKDMGVGMIKAAFELHDVDHYVFISEAWVLDAKTAPDAEINRIAREGLANHPDRREAIAFAAENRDGEMLTARRYILRPEHGKAKLAPLIIDDMSTISESSGRMVGLLRRVK